MDKPVANMVLVPVDAVDQLERYEQFVDGWGDEVLGLKQHPKGDYVKFEDVRAMLSAASQPSLEGEASELIAWLEERSKPDSGIRYGDNSSGVAEATFSGYDAAFVAEHFHGRGAARLACLLRTLSADNARLREERDALTYKSTQSTRCACGEEKHTPLRRDDMEGYVCLTCIDRELTARRIRADAAEARLSEAVEVLKPFAMEGWADENGWTARGCPRDRVCDWFGPSDFRAARQFLDTQGGGNG